MIIKNVTLYYDYEIKIVYFGYLQIQFSEMRDVILNKLITRTLRYCNDF